MLETALMTLSPDLYGQIMNVYYTMTTNDFWTRGSSFLGWINKGLKGIGWALIAVAITLCGILMTMGDSFTEKAKQRIIWVIVGAVVIGAGGLLADGLKSAAY